MPLPCLDRLRRCAIAVTAMALPSIPAWADPGDALREALSAIPVAASADAPLGPAFADFAAGAGSVAAIPFFDRPLLWQDTATAGITRARPLNGIPDATASMVTDWPARLGFGPGDVLTVTGIDAHPDRLVRLELRPGLSSAVTDTLTANGHSVTETPGGSLFRRGDTDYSTDLAGRDPGNPFGGNLGQASRFLMQGDVLYWSPGMPALDMVGQGGATWADRPDLMAAITALHTLPDGAVLVRAQVLPDPLLFAPSGPEAGDVPGIPPWSVGLMVDAYEGMTGIAAIGFVYATEALATEAATGIIAGWDILLPTRGATPAEFLGQPEITVTGTGPFVTMVVLQGETVAEGYVGNLVFNRLWDGVLRGDLALFGPPAQ